MATRPVIAGHWKMHHGPGATRRFLERLESRLGTSDARVALFPPALSFAAAVESLPGDRRVELGVQNIHWESSGAFTGEVSAEMAAEAGAELVLVGHSERRHVFGETDEEVARKVAAALRTGLVPVVCVGETLEQREDDRVEEVVLGQLRAAMGPLADASGPPELMLAYEPVWAIGTGKTATPSDASHAHGVLRRFLRDRLGAGAAESVPILYGGSVKPHNAAELLSAPDVDGVLVGGASLDPDSFGRILAEA